MAAVIATILALVGMMSVMSVFVVAGHEVQCLRRKDWLSALFGMALILSCIVIALACFTGFGSLL